MSLAPLVGVGLGAVAAGLLAGARHLDAPPLLGAALAFATLALLTRGLHLDGLADTADGLGSGRPATGALEIMRRSDIGPFGVLTLTLVMLVDVTAAAALPAGALVAAVGCGRAALPLACRRSVPSARSDGLGAAVTRSVPLPVSLAIAGACVLMAGLAVTDWRGAVAALAAFVCGQGFLSHCVRRLGGITGDVLGALVELTTVILLVVLSLLWGSR